MTKIFPCFCALVFHPQLFIPVGDVVFSLSDDIRNGVLGMKTTGRPVPFDYQTDKIIDGHLI